MRQATRFIVSGRVQGVFFRASTRERARQLGLCGCARNLADGAVEVIAAGTDDAIEGLALWLQHGPPRARVDRVERSSIDVDAIDGFPMDDFSVG